MASTSGTAKAQPVHGRATQRRESTSTSTAAAEGGAVASQPPRPPQPRPGTTRPPLWRPPRWPWGSSSSAATAAAPGGASTAAASQGGGSAASRPPRPPRPPLPPRPPRPPLPPLREPGEGGGRGDGRGATGTGSSSAAAAVDRKGKKKVDEGDRDPEQALRKSGPLEGKLLQSSIRAYQGPPAAEKPSGAPPAATPPARNTGRLGLSDREADDALNDIDLAMARQLPVVDTTVQKEEEEKEKEKEKEEEEEDDDDEEGELLSHVSRRKNPLRSRIDGYISMKFSMEFAPDHYCLPGLRGIISSNFLILVSKYSEFRAVHGDGECFYRSFIISYLEQVLDREDTDEEQRLLAALEIEVKPMAMQIDYPEWATAFSWGHEVFKKLIENIIGWKNPASTYSRKQELLGFFSSKRMSNGIFVFLRSLAATWICSHKDEYEQYVDDLGDDYPLEFWCATNLLPPRLYTDHVPMRALAAAFRVPLQVENLHNGPAQDIYTADGVDVPRVTLLYTGAHYDILYPRPPGERSRRRAAGWLCRFW
uniref:OTU domain-containing protein n=1 Tax=Oryza rufipogon TaxID=4529 RepID=A0A0E0NFM3_ORYRU